MSAARTDERNETAERLVAAEGCGACGYATHEALKARAVADPAGERVWTEILGCLVAEHCWNPVRLAIVEHA